MATIKTMRKFIYGKQIGALRPNLTLEEFDIALKKGRRRKTVKKESLQNMSCKNRFTNGILQNIHAQYHLEHRMCL